MDPTGTWFALMPPLLAIVVALIWRSVIPALFLGLWLAAWGLAGLDPAGLLQGLLDTLSLHVVNALADEDHASILLFSLMIGGLVGVIGNSGGMQAVVVALSRYAGNRQRGQLATAGLGLAIFVDDYANSLVVGKTMGPLTGKLGISREKLAYLVDSTAAPVTALALVSTWIGYQVSLISDALAPIESLQGSGYLLFLQSLSYSFYPWLCLFLVFYTAGSGRDIGPMVQAERRAGQAAKAQRTEAQAVSGQGQRMSHAILPLLVLIVGVLVGLWVTGDGEGLREIIGSGNPYKALIWASMAATFLAFVLPWRQSGRSMSSLLGAWIEGLQSMIFALVILVLAWALAATTKQLGAAQFMVLLLGDALPAAILPALVFLLAGLIAFATGTSWGTMGILIPLVVPLGYTLAPHEPQILQAALAAVLAGAIWGDHCSPISDTTILSSMACDCDHVEHVRTQMPYALLAGGAALLLGFLPAGLGLPWWLCLLSGMLVILLFMRFYGRRPEQAAG